MHIKLQQPRMGCVLQTLSLHIDCLACANLQLSQSLLIRVVTRRIFPEIGIGDWWAPRRWLVGASHGCHCCAGAAWLVQRLPTRDLSWLCGRCCSSRCISVIRRARLAVLLLGAPNVHGLSFLVLLLGDWVNPAVRPRRQWVWTPQARSMLLREALWAHRALLRHRLCSGAPACPVHCGSTVPTHRAQRIDLIEKHGTGESGYEYSQSRSQFGRSSRSCGTATLRVRQQRADSWTWSCTGRPAPCRVRCRSLLRAAGERRE